MVLEKYKQKRNFRSTPEPAGDLKLAAERARKAQTSEALFFCVQKHLASHLHYDFRLEHSGVLLSWAVPKGPSLDPKVKRLAMHVEDHPIEYGTFEGVIPEGYGAGIVMLWDQGTWKPESPDVDAALKKGDLKFTLDGYKLKGSWVLVRTGGRWGAPSGSGDARSWLLIKHRDEWAGELDITDFAPKSVKSEGDFEDILAADRPDVWVSNKAAAPARGGEAGAMLAKIIERAAALKAGQTHSSASGRREGAGASGRREAPQGGARERQARGGGAPRAQAPAAGASGRREAPQRGARERQARGGGAPRAQEKPQQSSARPRTTVPRKSTGKRKTSARKR